MAEKIKLGSNGNFGVKEGGTLAYNDENGVFKAIELASSRASGATYVAESGLIADAEVGVPRIDYTNGVGELLLEPQSTNLITYSEDFTDASWNKSNVTINANTILSPDGSLNADLMYPNSSGTFRRVTDLNVTNSGGSISFFAKSGGLRYISIPNVGAVVNVALTFDLQDGVIDYNDGTYESKIEDYGNGWYRCSVSYDGVSDFRWYVLLSDGGSSTTITANGTDGVYIWGAQRESLSYATSYIRTSGSSVTRIADAVTGNSSLGQVINSSEGVLYFKGLSSLGGVIRRISLSDGTANNRVIFQYQSNNTELGCFIAVGGSNQVSVTNTPLTQESDAKIAVKWKENDFAIWINGVEVYTDSVGSTFSANTLNKLSLDDGLGVLPFYGRIKELKVYDTALTDAELQTLTTL